jgi:hypothetical protein
VVRLMLALPETSEENVLCSADPKVEQLNKELCGDGATRGNEPEVMDEQAPKPAAPRAESRAARATEVWIPSNPADSGAPEVHGEQTTVAVEAAVRAQAQGTARLLNPHRSTPNLSKGGEDELALEDIR